MDPQDTQDDTDCAICHERTSDDPPSTLSKLYQKEANKINESSMKRDRDDVNARPGQTVHKKCRLEYNRNESLQEHKPASESSPVTKRVVRASKAPFNCRTDCLFCGFEIKRDEHGRGDIVSAVKTDAFPKTISSHCEERFDDWSFTVKGRIEYFAKDLHAADCLYHQQCSVNFRTGRDLPEQFKTKSMTKYKKTGRPKNEDQQQAFLRVCAFLEENDEEQLTISDLVGRMRGYLLDASSVSYGNQYMKEKLKNKYGDSICIAEQGGESNIVTMREKTSQILFAHYKNTRSSDEESQRREIIATAARLIKSDIKNIPSETGQYPSSETLSLSAALDYLPDSLRLLLDLLFVGTNKQEKVASVGQSIIQAVRPRAVVAPLQIGLSVQMHHIYRSKFLVDTLSKMGFCASYGELQRFEKNAAALVAPNIVDEEVQGMLLFAADNVDHNINTLDGKGTFHGMGMMAAVTPGNRREHVVARRKAASINVTNLANIDIVEYRFSNHARKNIVFDTLPAMESIGMLAVDLLWELSFCFRQPTPNWQGMMNLVHCGNEYPGKSSVTFLPLIDMYPGDHTCILSTLTYITNLARKHRVPPVVTFDQPLFWKASEIIYNAISGSSLKEIILMLGTFHTFMNVLGAIGTLMRGTGLREILEEVHGENAVKHMLSGKSTQRAFRGHLLVEKCLNGMIISELMERDPSFATLVSQCEDLYKSLISGNITLECLTSSDLKTRVEEAVEHGRHKLIAESRTSKMWLLYMGMVQTCRKLIMADRMGSWDTHLRAFTDSLPIFAAAGHFNYLKSAYLYLQNMQQLEQSNPQVYQKFLSGFHVIRRTDKFWSGLGADLVIEQTLMRSLKSNGGLTRGSGMTEGQRALWTLASPVCSEYNIAMQDFTHHPYTTREQHKDSTESRMKRDQLDLGKLEAKIESCHVFSGDSTLRNVITGVVAKDNVNVDEFISVGKSSIEKMIGQPAFTHTFKRKDKAITMGIESAVRVTEDRSIDSALLFQRLLVISRDGALCLQDVLDYELSPFPPALFEAKNILQKADKPQLAKAIREYSSKVSDHAILDKTPTTDHFVLDGGSLLHRVKWSRGETYGFIADKYVSFTIKNYGRATVVFDGYENKPSIKDNTHMRRQHKMEYPVINCTSDTVFVGKRDDFLARGGNKQQLINIISEKLREKDCHVINSPGDADYDIVQAAVASSEVRTTTLIGEDTDLLILLLYHCNQESKDVYFRSDKANNSSQVYNIKCIKNMLGDEMCSRCLFVHAYTGCDSTSRIFNVGKKSLFQKLMKGDPVIKECAVGFTETGKRSEEIEQFGRKVMVSLFGGNVNDTLASLRYNVLTKKVVSAKSFVTPERLPPTESATKYHSLK